MPELSNYENRIESHLKKTDAQLDALNRECSHTKTRLAGLVVRDDITALKTELQGQLLNAVKLQKSQSETRQKDVVLLQDETKRISEQLQAVRRDGDHFKQAIHSLECRVDVSDPLVQGIRQDLKILTKYLEDDVRALEKARVDLNLLISNLETRMEIFKTSLSTHTVQVDGISREMVDLRLRIQNLDTSFIRSQDETRAHTNRLQDRLQNLEQTSSRIEKRILRLGKHLQHHDPCCVIL